VNQNASGRVKHRKPRPAAVPLPDVRERNADTSVRFCGATSGGRCSDDQVKVTSDSHGTGKRKSSSALLYIAAAESAVDCL
jgi:hypothetical protein